MAFITIKPTTFDQKVAEAVAKNTTPQIEDIAGALTWGADEHVLLAVASICWLVSRGSDQTVKRAATHFAISMIVASVAPRIAKDVINQERPDRKSYAKRRRSIPESGNAEDAFPSGHAVHMGALASYATLLPSNLRYTIWAFATLMMGTRIVLLAHWVSDVAVGFATGIVLERIVRRLTRPHRIRDRSATPR